MIIRLLRVVVGLLAAAVIFGVISGRGGNRPTAATATAKGEAPITKAEAIAYARMVNLRPGDLVGTTVSKAEHEGKPPSEREAHCMRGVGAMPYRRIINRSSAVLGRSVPGEFDRVSSAVEVLPNAALMVRHNAANRSPRALTCASRLFTSDLSNQSTGQFEYGPVTVSRLPDPLPGISGAFEYRIATTIIAGGAAPVEPADYAPRQVKRIPFYFDIFGFISGPAEINLTAIGAPQPVPEKIEQHLLALLYSRAGEHSL